MQPLDKSYNIVLRVSHLRHMQKLSRKSLESLSYGGIQVVIFNRTARMTANRFSGGLPSACWVNQRRHAGAKRQKNTRYISQDTWRKMPRSFCNTTSLLRKSALDITGTFSIMNASSFASNSLSLSDGFDVLIGSYMGRGTRGPPPPAAPIPGVLPAMVEAYLDVLSFRARCSWFSTPF